MRSTHHHDDHLCGDHDRCAQFNHDGDSATLHHHHGPADNDILIHDHSGHSGHRHYIYNPKPNGAGHYDDYANAHHGHRVDDNHDHDGFHDYDDDVRTPEYRG